MRYVLLLLSFRKIHKDNFKTGSAEQPRVRKGILPERFLNLYLSDRLPYVEMAGCLTEKEDGYQATLEAI